MTNDGGVNCQRLGGPGADAGRLGGSLLALVLGVVLAGCAARGDASGSGNRKPSHQTGAAAASRRPVTAFERYPGQITLGAGQQVTVRLGGLDMNDNYVEPLRSSAAAVVRIVQQSPVYVGSTTMTATLRGVRAGTATLSAATRPLCACKGKPSRVTIAVAVTDPAAG